MIYRGYSIELRSEGGYEINTPEGDWLPELFDGEESAMDFIDQRKRQELRAKEAQVNG